MTLKHIKIFIEVCDCGGITKAAQKLYLAQPSVSLAIKELEEYYGVKLFDRLSRRLYLTEYGKAFYRKAKQIVNTYDELENEIHKGGLAVPLRIGSSITVGNCLMPQYVKCYRAAFPNQKVEIKIDSSQNIIKELLESKLDIAVIEGIAENRDLLTQALQEDELALLASTKSPLADCESVTIDKLSQYDFFLREKGSGTRSFFDSLLLLNNTVVNVIGESVSTQAVLAFVKENLALSVLPLRLAQKEIDNQTIKRIQIENVSLKRKFYIVRHRNKELSEEGKSFIQIMKQSEGLCD